MLDLVIYFNPLICIEMVGGQDVSLTKSFESKFDALINAVNALSTRLAKMEGVA